MFQVFVAALFLVLAGPRVSAEELTFEKERDVRRLLDISSQSRMTNDLVKAYMDSMARNLKQSRYDIPERFFEVLQNEVTAIVDEEMHMAGGLTDQLAPIYAKYFLHEEVKALIAFYESPLGQKVLATMPDVLRESRTLSEQWFRTIAPSIRGRVQARLKAEGIEIPRQ
jgi:uncharacterized protein